MKLLHVICSLFFVIVCKETVASINTEEHSALEKSNLNVSATELNSDIGSKTEENYFPQGIVPNDFSTDLKTTLHSIHGQDSLVNDTTMSSVNQTEGFDSDGSGGNLQDHVNSTTERAQKSEVSNNAKINKVGTETLKSSPSDPLLPNSGSLLVTDNKPKVLSSNHLIKRILHSPDSDVNANHKLVTRFQDDDVDAWRPLFPHASLSIQPSFASHRISSFHSFVKPSLHPQPNDVQTLTVPKEPVTAYYFDLATVSPTKQIGPLYDPSFILNNHPLGYIPTSTVQMTRHSNKNAIQTSTVHYSAPSIKNVPSTSYKVEALGEGENIAVLMPSLKEAVYIEPTPTFSQPIPITEIPASESDYVSENLNKTMEEVVYVLDNDASESVTVSTSLNETVAYPEESTIETSHTAENFNDTQFTTSEKSLVEKSLFTQSPETVSSMPPILSSDQLSTTYTGEIINKDKHGLTSTMLFDIPIKADELPLPLNITKRLKNKDYINSVSPNLSRIPLWKRLSQTNSLLVHANKTAFKSIGEPTVMLSTTTSTMYNTQSFDDDLPIGILSAGILNSNVDSNKNIVGSNDIDNPLNEFSNSKSTPYLPISLSIGTTHNSDRTFTSKPLVNINKHAIDHSQNTQTSSSILNNNSITLVNDNLMPIDRLNDSNSAIHNNVASLANENDVLTGISTVSTPISHAVNTQTSHISSNKTSSTDTPFKLDNHHISWDDFPFNQTITYLPDISEFEHTLINNFFSNEVSTRHNVTSLTKNPSHQTDFDMEFEPLTRNKSTKIKFPEPLRPSISPDQQNVNKSSNVNNPATFVNIIKSELPEVLTNANPPHAFVNKPLNPKNDFRLTSVEENTENISQIFDNKNSESVGLDNPIVKFTDESPESSSKTTLTDGTEVPVTKPEAEPEPEVKPEPEPTKPNTTEISDVSTESQNRSDTQNFTATSDNLPKQTSSPNVTYVRPTSSNQNTTHSTGVPSSIPGSTTAGSVPVSSPPSNTTKGATTESDGVGIRSTSKPGTDGFDWGSTTTNTTTTTSTPSTTASTTTLTTASMKETKVTTDTPTGAEKTAIDEHDQNKVIVVVTNSTDNEPELNMVKMHQNGTNITHPSPFIKAAVSYDILEFCRHHKNIETIFRQWINSHLANNSEDRSYEIEIFHQPDCENLYIHEDASRDLSNKTVVYFYVKLNGVISPNSTLRFPRDPTNLEISRELNYLKYKILHLELMNSSSSDLLIEEAAVGTSIIIAAIVTSLLVILMLGAVLAFLVIRKRRASDLSHGRRCTPAANDAYSMDSVSMFYHSFRRRSRKRRSNKSLKSYLNQGFDDPNGSSHPLNFVKLTQFISDNEAISEEFLNIPSVVPKYDEMPRGVEDKNRYANVIPVPETRILLGGNKTSPIAEYINANSIHGPKGELRYYIATQAPLDNTVCDFWQMVWEQETKVIVMLTDFVEKGVDKCADYLPPSETLDCHRVYGEFQITLKSRDMREKYVVSMLQIKNLENNLVREIAHMWYTGWPQSGIPKEEKLFISFILDVRMTRKQLRAKGPMIVHCSPGTGRTGTYILSDLCMRQFDDQKVVDIPKTVFRIRRERAGAVQTKDQYSFIYRVVNLYAAKLTTGNLDSF